MNINRQKHSITGVFAFLLLGLFALMSAVLVVFGAKAYQRTVQMGELHNEQRILSSYLRSMVRALDENGNIDTGTVEGVNVISMTETYGEDAYVTYLYCSDGYLREWFSEADAAFIPESGEPIIAASGMEAGISDGCINATLTGTDSAKEIHVCIALRSSQEVG